METQDKKESPTLVRAYEERDVKVRSILISALILGLLIVVVAWIGIGFFRYFNLDIQKHQSQDPMITTERALPSGPRLQVNEEMDYKTLRAQQDAVLSEYAWVDRQKGIVRIPIEKAITLVLERGLPYGQKQNAEENKD